MARTSRVTVRFEERELADIKDFADRMHILDSVALRWLVQKGLASQARAEPQTGGPKTETSAP